LFYEQLPKQSVAWVIYLKVSGSIKTDMTRDVGWDVIAQFQFIIVQLISINANYTAARARPADPIKVQEKTEYPETNEQTRAVNLPQVAIDFLSKKQ
jgi:hypothetical protein